MLQTDEVTFFAAISRVAIKSQNYKNINFCDLTPLPPFPTREGGKYDFRLNRSGKLHIFTHPKITQKTLFLLAPLP
jgi:hypothetical protein